MAENEKLKRNNQAVVAVCLALVFGMVGMSYAAVPLYRIFCQVTGFGGTVQEADAAPVNMLDQEITVRFDANVRGLPWSFTPDQRDITIKIGETKQISYRVKNLSQAETTGQATFNVQPDHAGPYFNKIQCFCFTEQTLAPGQEVEMPVLFFVDPDIVKDMESKDIKTITLSYTFYPHEKTQGVASVSDSKEKANRL